MVGIRKLDCNDPLKWLWLGWGDLLVTRFKGVFYGAVFVLMGYVIVLIYATKWQLTIGLIVGFFFMGPFLCAGIYDLSRQRQKPGKASLLKSLTCWTRNADSIACFAIVMTLVMIAWVRVSVVLFAMASTASFPDLRGLLQEISSLHNPQFLIVWCVAGFVFATIVFTLSVVAVPMMLDRKSDIVMAVLSSARSVHANPIPLFFWAVLVALIIGLSLALSFIPLLITVPLVGHASWHAYRDLVEPASTISSVNSM